MTKKKRTKHSRATSMPMCAVCELRPVDPRATEEHLCIECARDYDTFFYDMFDENDVRTDVPSARDFLRWVAHRVRSLRGEHTERPRCALCGTPCSIVVCRTCSDEYADHVPLDRNGIATSARAIVLFAKPRVRDMRNMVKAVRA